MITKNCAVYIFAVIFLFEGVLTFPCPYEDLWNCLWNPSNYPVKTSKNGLVGGKCSYSPTAGVYICNYLGIPYVQPPIDDLRFMPPKPPISWTSILWGLNSGSICLSPFTLGGSEDCLRLNIITPKGKCTPNCPVLFWMHGGGFILGSGESDVYSPDYLLQFEDVILVTFNYRLSVFGFSCTENKDIPGNAGIADQQAALAWIYDNIGSFGGDPTRITIFGESAGSASVAIHCNSKGSQGKFKRAILQSGTNLCPWAFQENPLQVFKDLAKLFFIYDSDTTALTAKMKSISADALNLASGVLTLSRYKIENPLLFVPHIDYNNEPYISENPWKVFNESLANNKSICEGADVMIGMVKDEGGLAKINDILDPNYLINLPQNKEALTPRDCNYISGSPESVAIGNKIYDYYYGTDNNNWNFYKYVTGYHFLRGVEAFYETELNAGKKVYIYSYQYCGWEDYTRTVLFPTTSCSQINAIHSDDIWALFPPQGFSFSGVFSFIGDAFKLIIDIAKSANARLVSKRMVKMWINFAKYGDPTPGDIIDPLFGAKWYPSVNKSDIKLFGINTNMSMKQYDYPKDIDFWNDVCKIN